MLLGGWGCSWDVWPWAAIALAVGGNYLGQGFVEGVCDVWVCAGAVCMG